MSSPLYINEISIQLLCLLDDIPLGRISQCDKYFAGLYRCNELWRLRLCKLISSEMPIHRKVNPKEHLVYPDYDRLNLPYPYYDIYRSLHKLQLPYKSNDILQVSVVHGHDRLLEFALDAGADIHLNNDYAIRTACELAHHNIVQLIVDRKRSDGYTYKNRLAQPLYDVCLNIACKNGYLSIVKLFVDEGSDISNGNALITACQNGHLEVVKFLLNFGVPIDMKNGKVLKEASSRGYLEIVQFLLEKGVDVHANDDIAIVNTRDLQVVKCLINAGANIRAKNDRALRNACRYGVLSVVELLLEIGANINANKGKPLSEAVCSGNVKLVKFLIDKGATVITGRGGKYMAPRKVCKSGNIEILKILLERCDDGIFNEMQSLLRIACKWKQIEIVKILLERVPHVLSGGTSVKNKPYYDAALTEVCRNGSLDIVTLLLKQGARGTRCALHEACKKGYYDIAKLLIDSTKKGINKDYLDDCLASACNNGHLNIVTLLIESGATVHKVSSIPLEKAYNNGHFQIVKLLIERGGIFEIGPARKDCLFNDMCRHGYYEIVELFIAKYSFTRGFRRLQDLYLSAVETCCIFGHINLTKLLVDNDAAIHKSNKPLINALLNNHMDIVKYLFSKGANISDNNYEFINYLVRTNNIEIITICLNTYENTAEPILTYGIMQKKAEIVILGLSAGAGSIILNEGDSLPLSLACQVGDVDIVRLLLDNGANIHASDDEALDIAALNDRMDVVDLLLQKGARMDVNDYAVVRTAVEKRNKNLFVLLHSYDGSIVKFAPYILCDHKNHLGPCKHNWNA